MNPRQPLPVRIRPATPADALRVLALFQAHLKCLEAAPDPSLDADMHEFPQAYQSQGGYFCVAETDNGEIVAMGGIRHQTVCRLHVAASARGHQLGQQIVRHLCDWYRAQGGESLLAIVARSNTAAQKVFAACGFSATGRSPDHPRMQHCEIWQWTSIVPPQQLEDNESERQRFSITRSLAPNGKIDFRRLR